MIAVRERLRNDGAPFDPGATVAWDRPAYVSRPVEGGVSMSNKRREVERNAGVFLSPSGSAAEGGYVVPMENLNVGPGKPGPGDEWHMPAAPGEIENDETAVMVDPARPGRPAGQ
jgi:hypothetical protein